MGLSNHPELRQHRPLVAAAEQRVRPERWRPWLPHLAVGYDAGFDDRVAQALAIPLGMDPALKTVNTPASVLMFNNVCSRA